MLEPAPDPADPADQVSPADQVAPGATPMTYEQFGVNFIRMLLDAERVCRSVDQVLGESLRLGPMGAGPGRVMARVTAEAQFRPTYGHAVAGDRLRYRIALPLSVDFEVDLRADRHLFRAEVLVPLLLTVHVEPPLRIVCEIEPPRAEEVEMTLATDTRRGTLLQRMASLDAELRQFLVRVIARELDKPHVRDACDVDVQAVIDGAWTRISQEFLPSGPEDRLD